MPFSIHRHGFQQALKSAAILPPKSVVALTEGTADTIEAADASTDRPFGVTQGSSIAARRVTVYEEGNVVQVIAGASLGANTEVGIATYGVASAAQDNVLATVAQLGPISAASGTADWAVGVSEEAAAAGAVFSVLIKPRQLGDQA